jgi:hypothetical protein
MAGEGHEGWKNYPTWAYALYIGNQRTTAYRAQFQAKQAIAAAPKHENVANGIWSVAQTEVFILADTLKDEAETLKPELSSPWGDLLTSAMGNIEWQDIAENLIGEIKLQADTELLGDDERE